MGVRFSGQLDPNLPIHQVRGAASDDVWTSQTDVIKDYGLGQQDLWERLVLRHEEVLRTGAISSYLYKSLNAGFNCTCIKDETRQVDQRCPICYGTRFIGGYEKFGYSTIFIADGNDSFTLTDGVVDTTQRHHRIKIADGKTQATLLSKKYQITGSLGFNSFQLSAFDSARLLTQDNFTVEYTVDGGENFIDITKDTTPLAGPALIVQFRVTIKRDKLTDSPFMNILRVRFQTHPNTTVLISKRTFPEQRWLESFGVQVKLEGITWWTTPTGGHPNGDIVRIFEDDFFELGEGFYSPQTVKVEEFPHSGRAKPINVTYVEPQARFLSQRFNVRMTQLDEIEKSVF